MSMSSTRLRRRSYAIHGYVGANGAGKSAAMVYDTLPSLDRGRPVLSTVRLLDWRNPRLCDDPLCDSPDHERHMAAHPLWTPLTDWHQLMDFERGDVLLDEVTGVASARESQGLPFAVANLLVQLRRRDVLLRWSAPAWSRADKILRETTQGLTEARVKLRTVDKSDDRAWQRTRLSKIVTYDASDYESWSEGKRDKVRPRCKAWARFKTWEAVRAYDTFDVVTSIATVTDAGTCVDCGGHRSRPTCSCEPYLARVAEAKARGAAAQRGPRAVAPPAFRGGRHAHAGGH